MYRIGIDVGGTFTDFTLLRETDGRVSFHKVPSTPRDPSQAIEQGIADLDNAPGWGFAGSATAALFLRRFVEGPRYLHFDIYAHTPAEQPARGYGRSPRMVVRRAILQGVARTSTRMTALSMRAGDGTDAPYPRAGCAEGVGIRRRKLKKGTAAGPLGFRKRVF